MAGRTLEEGSSAARAFTVIKSRTAMTPEEKKTLTEMCERIQEEQEPIEFQRLVVEMLDLLEQVAPKRKAVPRAN
jgi:hypothetical protein